MRSIDNSAFMKEMASMVEAAVCIPEGIDKELYIQSFIRQLVIDKVAYIEQPEEEV